MNGSSAAPSASSRLRDLRWPALAAVAGLVLAAMVHTRPASQYQCRVGRDQAIAQGTRTLHDNGFDITGWTGQAYVNVQRRLAAYAITHPQDPFLRLAWPTVVHVLVLSPDRKTAMVVDIACTGRTLGWQAGASPRGKPDDPTTARRVAESAMQALTGEYARDFRPIADAAPTPDGLSFSWDSTWSGPHVSAEVTVRNGKAVTAALKPDTRALPDSLPSAFSTTATVLIFISGTVVSLVLYAFGVIRRRVNHRFALTVAAGAVAFSLLDHLWGSNAVTSLASEVDNGVVSHSGFWFGMLASLLGVFAGSMLAAGAGLYGARAAAPKWNTFCMVLSGVPGRRLGVSLAAGLLAAPLVPALQDFLNSLGSTPQPAGLGSLAELYAPFPLAGWLDEVLNPVTLGIAGVLLPLLWGRIPRPALRWTALLAVLCLAFGVRGTQELTARSVLVGAVEGVALVLIFGRFDVLATLALQAGTFLWTFFWTGWTQPAVELQHEALWGPAVYSALLLGSVALAYRGREVTEDTEREPLKNVQSERERLQAEFSVARRAQQRMLPAEAPDIPGFDLCASCTPAREVAGDLYDFLRLPDGYWGITVADVSGKGVPAALYMTLTKGLLASAAETESDPVCILRAVNGALHQAAQRKVFVTMMLGVLDPRTRVLELARAGHNPAVWHSPMRGQTTLLGPAGIGLGLTSPRLFDGKIQVKRLDLAPGDTLVFYSDGLTEAMNRELEEFGEERLMAAVKETEGMSAAEAHEHIQGRVQQFLAGVSPQDDLTLVVVKVTEAHNEKLPALSMAELLPEEELVGHA